MLSNRYTSAQIATSRPSIGKRMTFSITRVIKVPWANFFEIIPDARGRFDFFGCNLSFSISEMSLKMYTEPESPTQRRVRRESAEGLS